MGFVLAGAGFEALVELTERPVEQSPGTRRPPVATDLTVP